MGVLLITNDRPPYFTDAANILAQRHGALYRFRYERRVGTDLIGPVDVSRLAGAWGAVLLRNWTSGKLVPIRGIRMTESVLLTQYMAVLNFQLLDFPEPNAKGQWDLIHDEIKRQRVPNDANSHMVPLVLQVDDSLVQAVLGTPVRGRGRAKEQEEIDRWRDAIQSISGFSEMGHCCFLYPHRMEDETGRSCELSETKDGHFLAEAATTYSIKVSQYIIHKSPLSKRILDRGSEDALPEPIVLHLQADPEEVRPIERRAAIVGRYDELRLSFRTQTGAAQSSAIVEIAPTKHSRNFYIPVITLNLDIRYPAWQLVALGMGFLLTVFGFLYDDRPATGLLKTLQEAGTFKLILAAGVVLISSLGQDFHLSLFKRFVNWYKKTVDSTKATD